MRKSVSLTLTFFSRKISFTMELLNRLANGEILICDGAMGTLLQERGLPLGVPPEEWNLSHPEIVAQIHRDYLSAGAEIVETNTFGGNRLKLSLSNLADQVERINREAVRIAREAVGDKAYVALSVGPTGRLLEPWGDLPFETALAAYKEQIGFALKENPDLVILETFSDLQEIKAGVLASQELGILTICTMTFESSGRTIMGVSPEKAIEELSNLGVKIIGTNCGTGPEDMLKVVEIFAKNRPDGVFLIAQPNAGVPKLVGGKTVFDATPELMAEYAKKYVGLGVNIVGACCGSTPAHIKAIRETVKG
ncbi:homocysteine S-methyltransferase family protein [bacterium]|nr:homocysteine S-methyltransferase family protein [bacterium]